MEVKKLYYENCHQRTFTARVTGCREGKGGWEVTLDQSAFIPKGAASPAIPAPWGRPGCFRFGKPGRRFSTCVTPP